MFRRVIFALSLLVACAPDAQRAPARDAAGVQVTDDGGRVIRLPRPAQRVISLIPSATETIMALGATDRVVGRTRYDVAPELAQIASVGGGLDPSIEAVVALKPDLVLAWENDKRRDAPNKLTALGIPVYSMRTEDTTDIFRGIARIGTLLGRDSAAKALTARLHAELDTVRQSVAGLTRPTAMYVVFPDPPMTAGPNTFIGQLIGLAGGRSVFDDQQALWPNVTMEEIVKRAPEVIVLPTGEFRTSVVATLKARPGWRELAAVKNDRVRPVDANLLSRPGPNVAAAARALRDALHPELARR